jgi:hypothetical protein
MVKDDLGKMAMRFGYVDSIGYPDSLELFGMHTYVTIKFLTRGAALAAQRELAGQYYLGRAMITMVVHT